MAYATSATWTAWKGGKFETRVCTQVLRGQKIFRGAMCYQHNGRAMPAEKHIASLLASGVSAGGPLLFAGADANGGIYAWAKRQGVRFAIVNGGSSSIAIAYGSALDITLTTPVASTTANAALQLLLAHPIVVANLGFAIQGTGAGLVAATALTAPPVITPLGIAAEDADNSADAVNDADLPVNAQEFRYGEAWMSNDASISVTRVPGNVEFIDDLMLSTLTQATRYQFYATDLDSRQGVCVRIP